MSACAEIKTFPIDRRMDLVRSMVEEILPLNGERADAYWHGTAKRLLAQLVDSGRTMDAARTEVRALFYAVHNEMRKTATAVGQSITA